MLVLTISLLACKSPAAGVQPDQLEAPEVSNGPNPQEAITIEGNNAFVDGADRDWSVSVSIEGEKYGNETEWHVPGASDLSVLEGSSLRIELGGTWADDTQPARIDQDGSPRFLIQPSGADGPATDLFGYDFVSFGDEVGTGTMEDEYGTWEVSYKKAVFATDAGRVEADPGEPFVATIDGEDWRIVVHGSFEVTDTPDTLPGCGGGIGTTLSFEMLKVDATPPTEPVAPLAGARQSGHTSCG
jgi:hypothetical protein